MSGSSVNVTVSDCDAADLAFDHKADFVWSVDFPQDEPITELEVKQQINTYEFVTGEQTFLKLLLVIKHAYREPFLESNILPKDVCDVIFPDLTKLIEIIRKLKDDCINLKLPNGRTSATGIADRFLSFFDRQDVVTEFAKIAFVFRDNGDKLIKEYTKKNQKFVDLLQVCDANAKKLYNVRDGISSLIMAAPQRSMRYPLVLSEVLKRTEKETEEHNQVSLCYQAALDFAQKVQAEKENVLAEHSARSWLLNKKKSSVPTNDCLLNVPVKMSLEGTKGGNVNLVLYDECIVLFPSDPESKTKTHYIAFDKLNVHVSKSEDPCKFFIVTSTTKKHPPKVFTIECKEDKIETVYRSLNEACTGHTVSKLDKKFADITTSTGSKLEDTQRSIAELDANITTLLNKKFDLMMGIEISKDPNSKDFTQSVNGLTSETEALHQIAKDLLNNYEGEDKDVKSNKINEIFTKIIKNLSGVTCGYQTGCEEKKEPGFFKKMRQSIVSKPNKGKSTTNIEGIAE